MSNIGDHLVNAFAILCAALVLLSPAACTISRHRAIVDVVKSGADPIAAKCAIEADTDRDPVCMAYAMKGKP